MTSFGSSQKVSDKLANGELVSKELSYYIPENTDISQPYWLKENHNVGIFTVSDQTLIGLAEEEPKLNCDFELSYKNHLIKFINSSL